LPRHRRLYDFLFCNALCINVDFTTVTATLLLPEYYATFSPLASTFWSQNWPSTQTKFLFILSFCSSLFLT